MVKTYLVGGAVRDELLGLKPRDLDYVVVGSTPEEMLALGYKQVGANFPVFIHPETGDEYALARTEVKNGDGYQGFDCTFGPEVTLEDDLGRRDLTINSMAKDLDTSDIIDPFGGQEDIVSGILRPTTNAFRDDPVRILRAARFLARYPEFNASVELVNVMTLMVEEGDLMSLTPERIWKELERALSEDVPSRFFIFLLRTGIFPEIEAFQGVQEENRWHPESDVLEHVMLGIDYSSRQGFDPITTFGVLCHDLGKPEAYKASGGLKSTRHESLGVLIAEALCERLKAPADYTYMASKAAELHTHVHLSFCMKPKTIHKLFKRLPNRTWLSRLLRVALSDKCGRGKPSCDWVYSQPEYLTQCFIAMKSVKSAEISGPMLELGKSGLLIGEAIRRAEIAAIAAVDKSIYQIPYEECQAAYFKSLN